MKENARAARFVLGDVIVLLPEKDAYLYAAHILKPHASEKVAKFTTDLSRLGKELHAIAKQAVEGKNQLSLFEQVGVPS